MPAVFPWPTPEPGDLRDQEGRGAAVAREIVEWFVDRWAPEFTIPATSPLGAILESVARHERGEEAPPFASREEEMAWRHRILALRRLDWAIRALHGRAGLLRDVHQSFIKKELAGLDSPGGPWGMPTGIGTVCLAARLMQASGGTMTITGNLAVGHDIRWEPASGGSAVIERKDRAYSVGANEHLRNRIRYLVGRIREAGPALPMEPGVARVLAVGFPGFVANNQANRVRRRVQEELEIAVGRLPSPTDNPDYLIVDFAGARSSLTGGYDMQTSSQVIDFAFERPEWLAVRNGFSRAFTVQGAHLPGPWPIQAEYVRAPRPAQPARSRRRRRRK